MPPPWKDRAIQFWEEGHTLAQIGTIVGVTREWVRQILRQHGIVTRRPRRHACTVACTVVLAATPPISVIQLARRAGISWNRISRAAKIHGIPGSKSHHVCTPRCETMKELLARGLSFYRVAQEVGIADTGLSRRYCIYHPDWNWSRKRPLPAEGLKVSPYMVTSRAAQKGR